LKESHEPVRFAGDIVKNAVLIALLGVACGLLALMLFFNGGVVGLLSNLSPVPDPDSPGMQASRESVAAEIQKSFAQLQDSLRYNQYETATHDYCSAGSNDWKRSDGYAYRCSLRITKFYGFNGDFRQQMIDFEQKISDLGWKPPGYRPERCMEEMLKEYYDHYTTYQSGELLVSNLPSSICRYEKDGFSLELDFAEKETRSFSEFDFLQKVSGHSLSEFYDQKSFQDSALVIQKITASDGFALLIAIQKNYFQN